MGCLLLLLATQVDGQDLEGTGLTLPVETNGTGGGTWEADETWSEEKIPGDSSLIIVLAGDTLTVIGKVKCEGIMIKEGARLVFDPQGGSLTSRGDVSVAGAVEMGPSSELWIDCPNDMQYGIDIKSGTGTLSARGSHAFMRNCSIGARRRDGRHNTFIYAPHPRLLSFRACELSGLGGRMSPERGSLDCGIYFIYGAKVTIEDCFIHHCRNPIFVNAAAARIQSNEFVKNIGTAIWTRVSSDTEILNNYFHGNGEAVFASGKRRHAKVRVTGNLFEKNATGLRVSGMLGRSAFASNVYLSNGRGILLNSPSAPVAGETLAGNKYGVVVQGKTTGGRITSCAFGTFEDNSSPNKEADVRIEAPGPADVTLDGCSFNSEPKMIFDEDVSGGKASRWVKAVAPNQKPRRWTAGKVK